jgi:hypothetical protein
MLLFLHTACNKWSTIVLVVTTDTKRMEHAGNVFVFSHAADTSAQPLRPKDADLENVRPFGAYTLVTDCPLPRFCHMGDGFPQPSGERR